MPTSDPRHLGLLLSGAADVIPRDALEGKLALGRPLRVKLGIDPSRPDLHLGHAVVLRKLRQFQDLGHAAVLIIGDFTGLVGDPSGQSDTRPMLTAEEMEENARSYFEQAGLVLDMDRAEVRRNSEWLGAMSMADVLRLTSSYTVARMLERDDFQGRYREGRPISVVEFLYPLMQAYDSVAVEADVEMGGTDQTFNLLVGRDIQQAYGQDPQVVFTMPLLEGTDGTRKMSKSFDNFVGLTDPPEEMFGKLMSVPDELIGKYLRLCSPLSSVEADRAEAELADGSAHPNEAKRRMAREVVALYHGPEAARSAEERFDRVFREHEIPQDVPDRTVRRSRVFVEKEPGSRILHVPALLVELELADSRTGARRLIDQRGVRRDGREVAGQELPWSEAGEESLIGSVWQVGRRRFARVAALD
ncbi:MAG: tyrosine--tRNA ligase [Actinobacteria bacterium]|nr:tyrosine--tRNA ligase [Actinomycetota bacterium]